MTQIHLAIVLSWQTDKAPSNRRLETIVNSVINQKRANALVWQREREGVAVPDTAEGRQADDTFELDRLDFVVRRRLVIA